MDLINLIIVGVFFACLIAPFSGFGFVLLIGAVTEYFNTRKDK